MVDQFLASLAETNRSHLFYVDWNKARTNQAIFRDELALLQVLNREGVDARDELRRLLNSYPRINGLIPLLAACRIKPKSKKQISALLVIDENSAETVEYTFGDSNLTEDDISRSIEFAERTGLLKELTLVKNHSDYYFGVEVGMDTNARKNRSGTAMEALVEGHVEKLISKYNGQYLTQKTFKVAAEKFGVEVPPHQASKKGDFMLFINGKPYNIETNYFDGNGSKQEIMNSYIPRADDLAQSGWGFGLVTDGQGWLSNRNQLEEGFARIKHIYNIKMCSEGRLEDLLQ